MSKFDVAKREIDEALFETNLSSFHVVSIDFHSKTFGNFVAEIKSNSERLRIISDRSQYFLEYWQSDLQKFVDAVDIYPDLASVFSANINEAGLGEWSLKDLFQKWAQRLQT